MFLSKKREAFHPIVSAVDKDVFRLQYPQIEGDDADRHARRAELGGHSPSGSVSSLGVPEENE